jgi:hypothetical protein
MTGLPPEFCTLKNSPMAGVERPAVIEAPIVALIIGQAMCMIIRIFQKLDRR